MSKGQRLSELLLVAEGAARSEKGTAFQKGSHYGENALLEELISEETLTATSLVTLKVLSKEHFETLGLQRWRRRVAVRSVDCDPFQVSQELKSKSSMEARAVEEALMANEKLGPLVQELSATDLEQIASNAWRLDLEPEKQVVQQGSIKADYFYVVYEGHLEVIKDGEKAWFSASQGYGIEETCLKDPKKVGKCGGNTMKSHRYAVSSTISASKGLRSGLDLGQVLDLHPLSSFGELALLYRAPRAATVRSLTRATLFVVPRQDRFPWIFTSFEGV